MFRPECSKELLTETTEGRTWWSCPDCDGPPTDDEQRFLLGCLQAYRQADARARIKLSQAREWTLTIKASTPTLEVVTPPAKS